MWRREPCLNKKSAYNLKIIPHFALVISMSRIKEGMYDIDLRPTELTFVAGCRLVSPPPGHSLLFITVQIPQKDVAMQGRGQTKTFGAVFPFPPLS